MDIARRLARLRCSFELVEGASVPEEFLDCCRRWRNGYSPNTSQTIKFRREIEAS
jgi:hypothetical protein